MYATVFVPQLHVRKNAFIALADLAQVFFLRILDIYDRSLQGRLVEDYMAARHIDASDIKRKVLRLRCAALDTRR